MAKRKESDGPLDAASPNNPEAEATVIAAMLIDAEAVPVCLGILKPGDFFQERHGRMFQAAAECAERGEAVNQVAVAHVLSRKGQLEAGGGHAYLSQIVLDLPTSVGIAHTARLVARDAVYRRLIDAAGSIIRLGYAGEGDPRAAVEKAQSFLRGVEEGLTDTARDREVVFWAAMERVKKWAEATGTSGRPTGFPRVDRLTDGLQPGMLWYVGATTSTGKTAWCVNVAKHLVDRGLPVLHLSAEQAEEVLWLRFVGALEGVTLSSRHANRLEAADAIEAGLNRVLGLPYEAVTKYGMRVSDVRAAIQKRAKKGGYAAVVVDHLHLMRAQGKDRYEQVSNLSREFKALAGECEVPLIVAVQLHRPQGVGRAAEWKLPPPTLRDLRDAGNLEQDADVVILLSQMTEPTGAGLVDLLCQVAKNREGETGRCTLLFNRPRQQMWEQEERPGFGPASGETEP